MALPASGPISLLDIRNEFRQGPTVPISFYNYYKSGASGYVTTSDTAPNVPTSGALSLAQFRGAAANTYHASVSSPSLSGSCSTEGASCSAATGSTTVTVYNGSGNYTYSWAFVTGSGTSAVAYSPTAATTAFWRSGTASAEGITRSGRMRCTVHDNVSGLDCYAEVDVTTTHYII